MINKDKLNILVNLKFHFYYDLEEVFIQFKIMLLY